jgi:outer membrane lipoprotein SlyB
VYAEHVICNDCPGRKGAIKMHNIGSHSRGYVLAAVLGAIGGGLVVALVTRAIPRMMSQMRSGMMRNMMAQMRDDGCDPAEM